MNITIVQDRRRGCGWRHSGFYIMGDSLGQKCDLLPIPLDDPCPACGHGILNTKVEKTGKVHYDLPRNLSRINLRMISQPYHHKCDTSLCHTCAFKTIEWAYLIGVGQKHYPDKYDFIREAIEQGISKRINAIPNDFKVGETWIALAHQRGVLRQGDEIRAIPNDAYAETLEVSVVTDEGALVPNPTRYAPAIFLLFQANRIEYVIGEDDEDEYLESLEKKGITLVKVVRVEDTQLGLFDEEDQDEQDDGMNTTSGDFDLDEILND